MENNVAKYLPAPKWTMCSSDEAMDRERFNELSVLECTNDTIKANPKHRIGHPNRCVKKYRRSAAAGGVHNKRKQSRSLDDLETTVNYLLGVIFCTQTSSPSGTFQVSLLQSVLFVDDRIRAVQVDLTTMMGQSSSMIRSSDDIRQVRNIQAKILRYHLLSQHLLSDFTSKEYEWKFGHKALTTAITSYFATWDLPCHNNEKEFEILDEIMSYSTLLHIASIVASSEPSVQTYLGATSSMYKWRGLACEDGHGVSAILGIYRKYCQNKDHSFFPKYHWALRIATSIENGNYLSAIRHLSVNSNEGKVLSRCCVSEVMPLIRIGLLRLYNKSFMKREKIFDEDIANLLQITASKVAMNFCQSIGLPISSVESKSFVLMKAAPINIDAEHDGKVDAVRQIINPGRDEDPFVFGSVDKDIRSQSKITNPKDGMSSLQRAMAKVKIDNDHSCEHKEQNTQNENRKWCLSGYDNKNERHDEDEVSIPLSATLRQIIFQ